MLRIQIPECPISCEELTDPVNTPCGHTFNKFAIEEYCNAKSDCANCPTCRAPFKMNQLKPNYALKEMIEGFNKAKKIGESEQPVKVSATPASTKMPVQATYLKIRQALGADKFNIQEVIKTLENCDDLNGLMRYFVEQKYNLFGVIFASKDVRAATLLVEFLERSQVGLNPVLMINSNAFYCLIESSLISVDKEAWRAILAKCAGSISSEAFAANTSAFVFLGRLLQLASQHAEIKPNEIMAIIELFAKLQYGEFSLINVDNHWLEAGLDLKMEYLEIIKHLISKASIKNLANNIQESSANNGSCLLKILINHNRKIALFAQSSSSGFYAKILAKLLEKLLSSDAPEVELLNPLFAICQIIVVNKLHTLDAQLMVALVKCPRLLSFKKESNICLFHAICTYGRSELILKAIEMNDAQNLRALLYTQSRASRHNGSLYPLIILKNRTDINFADVFSKIIAKCPSYALDVAKKVCTNSIHAEMANPDMGNLPVALPVVAPNNP